VSRFAPPRRTRVAAWVCLAGLAAALAGCGESVGGTRLVGVAGKARVDGSPLATGTLSFLPDASKGNTSKLAPGGAIKADGTYTLFTEGRKGAPVGWYKVIVIAAEPVDPNAPYAPRRSFIDARYNTVETTDLRLEVTERPAPGAYDLDLKK
jgi:hypothetical protein